MSLLTKDAPMKTAMSKGGTKGSFKAAASKNNMGVRAFASHVLANKDKFSSKMIKKAVFAKNFAK